MSEPQPGPQAPPQGAMITPWGLDIEDLHAVNPDGQKVAALVITRNFRERIVCPALLTELEHALEEQLAKVRQLRLGIVIAPANTPLPPINGKRP